MKLYLGPSSGDYPPFDDSKWTLFEADTASASGKIKINILKKN